MHAPVVATVVEPAWVLAFVKVTEGAVAVGTVLHDEDGHGRRVDPGQRADRSVVVAATDLDVTCLERGDRLFPRGGETLEEGATDERLTLPTDVLTPWQRRTRGKDQILVVTGEDVAGRGDVDDNRITVTESLEGGRIGGYARELGGGHRATNPPSTRIVCSVM